MSQGRWSRLATPSSCSVSHLTQSVLTMDRHVTEVIRSCSYHTRALRHIRPLLTLDVAKMIGHSIVPSRLHYANAHCCTARRSTTSTGCRWRKIRWSGQFVKTLGRPVPVHRVASSASLAATSTADFLQGCCRHLQDTFHQSNWKCDSSETFFVIP